MDEHVLTLQPSHTQDASPAERRNLFEFLHLLSRFERRLGLQQRRDPYRAAAAARLAARKRARAGGYTLPGDNAVLDDDYVYLDREGDSKGAHGYVRGGGAGAGAGAGAFDVDRDGDMLVVQLGSKLKVGVRFFV